LDVAAGAGATVALAVSVRVSAAGWVLVAEGVLFPEQQANTENAKEAATKRRLFISILGRGF